jgi:hypothetical protein
MKLAIMQPYFFPYIGYFQLINAVDKFVIYDNIEFTKKGWINRNRILVNGRDEFITLPLKKDSDYLHVCQRYLADSFTNDKQKILRKIKESYRKAPYFDDAYQVIEEVFNFNNFNLFEFVFNSIKLICNYLDIRTQFSISSGVDINHNLKSQEKVLAICQALNASKYVNPIGGFNLYEKENFVKKNIELYFLQTLSVQYRQNIEEFIPWLSIIDVIMFNHKEEVQRIISNKYTLITN